METPHEVTAILQEWQRGDPGAPERLFPLIYDELRRRASYYISRERKDHTLQPTALVHEAYLRMVDQTSPSIENRLHFYAIASRVMRQVLVDHARSRNAEKRGGAAQRLAIDDIQISADHAAGDVLQLNEALGRLEKLDKRKCNVVDMRFFGGLKESEIAAVLGVNEKTVRRDWQFAKVWLYRELSTEAAPG
jgi:RNA polymerase sigma-70 factor (ECF subfamily)